MGSIKSCHSYAKPFCENRVRTQTLCDWVVFWNSEHDESQKNTFYSMISSIGITGFVKAVNIICIKVSWNEKKNVFMIQDEKTEVNTDIFLKDIIEAQEFGGTKDERMVVLRGSRFADYVKRVPSSDET